VQSRWEKLQTAPRVLCTKFVRRVVLRKIDLQRKVIPDHQALHSSLRLARNGVSESELRSPGLAALIMCKTESRIHCFTPPSAPQAMLVELNWSFPGPLILFAVKAW
jgi:hypothetical protein